MLDDSGSHGSRKGKSANSAQWCPVASQDVHLDGTTVIAAKTVWGALHGLETMSQLVDFNFTTGAAVPHKADWVWGRAGERECSHDL